MNQNKDINPLPNSHLFDALQDGFLAPSALPSVAVEFERLGMSKTENSSLFFSIVDQSSNAVVITDVNKNIIYVNKKFEHLSGYSLDQVIGKNPRILKSEQTSRDTYRDMHISLHAGQQWRGIFTNVHRNGNEYVEEAVISPIVNESGKVICFLAEKKDITAQRFAEDKIKRLTHFDSLTELPNRSHFIKQSERLLTHASNDPFNSFSILFADLNKFKELNDVHGHMSGDTALQVVAKRFSNQISNNDFIARIGGDEFVIIHKHATPNSTELLAKKLTNTLIDPIHIIDKKHFLDVSIGSATWPKDGNNLKELLTRSDLAMYKAKALKQSYLAYTNVIGYEYSREVLLSNKLANAIANKHLTLVYQPKVDLNSQQIVGVEALLRWHDPELGSISPVDFIPIAEKHCLMGDIGEWVISQACNQLNFWQSQGIEFNGRMAINISIQQIERPNFYDNLLAILAEQQIMASQIELEVTESVLIRDPQKIIYVLSRLVKLGMTVSIDDFGTGYSSMSYLKKLKASIIKIDRSFIHSVTTDEHDKIVVQSIIDLGHSLGLTVIAEGVETLEQLTHLISIGCDMAQGFYFAKPMPADNLVNLEIFKKHPLQNGQI